MPRPWPVAADIYFGLMHATFPMWLRERGGIVVYENHLLDSSHLGDRTYMPARYLAEEDNQLHDAPEEYRPNGGVPSMRQQRVDHIKLEDFGGSVDAALKCFCYEQEKPVSKPKKIEKVTKPDNNFPIWPDAKCGTCGHDASNDPNGECYLYRLQCPDCGREGCDECMPAGRGCACPECEESDREHHEDDDEE